MVKEEFYLGGGQPYLNLFKPIPILEAEGVIGLNRFKFQNSASR